MTFKYTEIKDAYIEVKKFLEYASGEKIDNLNTKVVEDLSLWGDDNYFMLADFIEKYNINFDKFNYDEHFESEGELIGLKQLIIGLVKLPFSLINCLIIQFISKSTYIFIDKKLYDRTTDKKDLTFGDLVMCKLNGEFCLRSNNKLKLAN